MRAPSRSLDDDDDDSRALASTARELRELLHDSGKWRLTDADRRLVQELLARLEELLSQP